MTQPRTRLAVVEVDQSTRNRLSMQLGDQVAGYSTVEVFADEIGPDPVVVVLGPSCAGAPGLMGAEELLRQRPDVGAILIAEELTTDVFQRAIRSGVRDVLAAPVDTAQLGEAVRRVEEAIGAHRAPAAIEPQFDGDGALGRVITVFSTKGGAGKSVVASNLGVSLAMRTDKPVVLVDADL